MGLIVPAVQELLAVIGEQLDRGIFPVIHNGGIVQPSRPAVEYPVQGVEYEDGQSGHARGSSTGSWQGTTGGQGAAGRTWSPGGTPPIIDAGIRRRYEAELDDIRFAYPGAKIWVYEQGIWLLTESLILEGLTRKATFLTAVPFLQGHRAFAWGYWTTSVSASWIGPRHTNFPDGSVCAFDPKDGTWSIGEPLVKLLDLFTLWALRHLHFEMFDRWPGYQSVPIAYERLAELKDHELCGCDQAHLRYSECCKPRDLALDRPTAILEFFMRTGCSRKPPTWVLPVIWGTQTPPRRPDCWAVMPFPLNVGLRNAVWSVAF